ANMHVEAAERLTNMNRLRQTVSEKSFVVHYQPKVSLRTGQVEGAEALLRWRDPDRGFIPPELFVPMLESEGLIGEVGEWVMSQALAQSEGWRSGSGAPLPVAVNV